MATATPPPIAGHTEYDVLDDRMRAGRFTSEGHYFYATDSDAIFHLTPTHPESTATSRSTSRNSPSIRRLQVRNNSLATPVSPRNRSTIS
jgi:hypothetical protein